MCVSSSGTDGNPRQPGVSEGKSRLGSPLSAWSSKHRTPLRPMEHSVCSAASCVYCETCPHQFRNVLALSPCGRAGSHTTTGAAQGQGLLPGSEFVTIRVPVATPVPGAQVSYQQKFICWFESSSQGQWILGGIHSLPLFWNPAEPLTSKARACVRCSPDT